MIEAMILGVFIVTKISMWSMVWWLCYKIDSIGIGNE